MALSSCAPAYPATVEEVLAQEVTESTPIVPEDKRAAPESAIKVIYPRFAYRDVVESVNGHRTNGIVAYANNDGTISLYFTERQYGEWTGTIGARAEELTARAEELGIAVEVADDYGRMAMRVPDDDSAEFAVATLEVLHKLPADIAGLRMFRCSEEGIPFTFDFELYNKDTGELVYAFDETHDGEQSAFVLIPAPQDW